MRERKTKQIPHTEDVPSFSQDEIKNEGKVYTPYGIVDDITTRYSTLLTPTSSICDPSMGQGNFLRRLFHTFISQGLTPDAAFDGLYGFDIDCKAVSQAQEYFTKQGVASTLVASHLLCINPILDVAKHLNRFDVVIGNPPYVRSPKDVPTTYKMRANLVDVFFEIGLCILKPEGTLIYIVQDSFLANEDVALRNYIATHNIKTLETRYDYSKAFRDHGVAVDICLVEIQKDSIQSSLVNVWKHQPFVVSSSNILPDTKWNIYPERVVKLNQRLQNYTQGLASVVQVKKGRVENNIGSIPASYGNKTYSKHKSVVFNVPVIGEPNLDYFFPKLPYVYTNFTKLVKSSTTSVPFQPFIALPYFTSKFRFCLIEDDVLTTPLVYTFNAPDLTWILPLLNNDVTDFQIRYNTKSRDTGYEFKNVSFDAIRFPQITNEQRIQLTNLTSLIKAGSITHQESNEWVLDNVYKLTAEERLLIKECQQYWFKKHVKTVKTIPSPY